MRRTLSFLHRTPRTRSGVTLIELMVGLGIAVVLGTLAAPSFLRQINSSRVATAASELKASLTTARSQAIQTGKPVTVCRTDASDACTTTTSAGWELGWIVFHDGNGNGTREPAEAVATRVAAMPSQVKVTGNVNVANKVTFRPSGTAIAGTLAVCSTSGALTNEERALKLVMIANGRIVLERSRSAVADTCPPLGTDD